MGAQSIALELPLLWPGFFPQFLLVAARVTALLLLTPVFGGRQVPVPTKVGFGLLVAFLVTAAAGPLDLGLSGAAYLLALGRELGAGLLAGFTVQLLFAAFQMAGGLAGLQMGLGFAGSINPASGQSETVLDQFYYVAAILVFLAIDGHHRLLLALEHFFVLVPLNTFSPDWLMGQRLVGLFSGLFTFAVQLALPIIGPLLLVDVALGLLSRVTPQLQVFFLGMPLKLAVGLAVLFIIFPVLAGHFAGLLQDPLRGVPFIFRWTPQ